eukprot:TRINITY_DN1167_c0_g2_i3.p1 TRINITY_DN1167_c0_g2~~TRINITY_DN1167_c0_g2_i3.p1  ORF type:complete len:196 (+),score=31.26 TRINITY_DN1167_c0_g2_i3:43-588(+)
MVEAQALVREIRQELNSVKTLPTAKLVIRKPKPKRTRKAKSPTPPPPPMDYGALEREDSFPEAGESTIDPKEPARFEDWSSKPSTTGTEPLKTVQRYRRASGKERAGSYNPTDYMSVVAMDERRSRHQHALDSHQKSPEPASSSYMDEDDDEWKENEELLDGYSDNYENARSSSDMTWPLV